MAQGSGMIPTILLTGFLGVGKTTLLNRLIEHFKSRRTVLLINEFGQVGIDGELLIEGNYEKIELNKGSLFCICVRTDFIAEVEKIAKKIQPELLIIEATGLADTSEMEKMLALPNLKDHVQLRTCVCLVDCQTFLKIKDNLRAPTAQIRSADLVLVNKIDLVDHDRVNQIISAIKHISAKVPIIPTAFAEFPLELFDSLHHPEIDMAEIPGDGRPDPVISITLEKMGNFTHQSWNEFKSLVLPELMRLKGFISLEGKSYYVDATMDRWSMTQWTKIKDRTNRLVLIGRNLDEEQIQERFFRTVVPEETY